MIKHRTDRGLRQNFGQLLIIGFDGVEISPRLASLLKKLQPAGVILFARNIVSAEQTCKLLKDCQACVSTRLFTCVDLEGGRVDRLRNVLGPAPAPADVFATGDRKLFRKHGEVIGRCCRAVGLNVDLAPVLDLALPASRSVMGSRAVSPKPEEVVIYAREFLRGLRSAGVIGAAKHFPGLGEANLDTHHELPSVSKSWKELWNADLEPYRVMRRELPMVLVGHANYSAVTRDNTPASLSKKWITDVLRKEIGFRGLIVSDDLEMGGVLKAAPVEQAAVEFVRAGGDLCLVCHQEEHVVRAYEALLSQTEGDSRFARRARESVERILSFKEKSAELKRRAAKPPSSLKLAKLSRELWEFSEQVRLDTIAQQAEA